VGQDNNIIIITGMSGAGKSKAVIALEDMGFFCVDNLPPALFGKFIEGLRLTNKIMPRTAIVADIRSGEAALPELEQTLEGLRDSGTNYLLLFLEAADEVLVRRYKENRRPHPLARNGKSTVECIRAERELLEGLRGRADIILDTSEFYGSHLAEYMVGKFGGEHSSDIVLYLTSFGFKYGIPIDADLVVDVRFLPNPYYVPELKDLTGLDKDVAQYVLENEVTREFLRHYLGLLRFLIPHYQQEGKKNLAVAVGCTGGRHRSVALAEKIGKRLRHAGYQVTVTHRDMDRGKSHP